MDRSAREAEELEWVNRYRPMVEMAAQEFIETGEWPAVEVLQRRMDRLRNGIEVQQAVRDMPKLPGEVHGYFWTNVTVPIRMFKHIPQGAHILPACLSIIQLSVQVWLSEADPPVIRSESPELLQIMPGRSKAIWLRAGRLVQSSQPTPLAGGNWGPDHWEMLVNGPIARQLSDVVTIDDYFDAQARIMEEAHALRTTDIPITDSVTGRVSVFVLMPFGESWSPDALDFFRLAAQSLNLDPLPQVYRADEIVHSDWITNQIIEAITDADAILADITGLNPNVMWELGYAQALNKPVVVVNQNIGASPFDVRGWRQVEYRLPATEENVELLVSFLQGCLGLDELSTS
jgi:hypothetical protein